MALNKTDSDVNPSALPQTSFLGYESEQEQECQDGGEDSSTSLSDGYISPNVTCLDSQTTALSSGEDSLNMSDKDCNFYICGYELIRRDRRSDNGGGICFYIKSTINFSLRTDLFIDELENMCIEIRKPNSKPFIVVNYYQ